ncbi:SDR family NAD(P)-dependent oxidoreductase [Gordonia sp. PKS22-38]|uniref:SDR family NAD(P)-dependent oxidoreductase n=1 Tax=Gordonia prachuapensis TaxID=3115651 RepID=A0ABU7MRS0_9ACTN|nr:SDR family NAD(P)-dependent oxidoreductase [Gordonia sp. PKS22-38]
MHTIVMTGATSGFGALAARAMTEHDDVRLIVGSRSAPANPRGDVLELDVTDLDSVRRFADVVVRRLDPPGIDALVLNAGVILADDTSRTTAGIETTFCANHLAPYLIARLLLPHLAEGGRMMFTTSGTHDPTTGAGLAVPRHADAELLAHPERDPDRHTNPAQAGQHAYTASKLCTVLTVRALNALPDSASRSISAIAYDPGQVFGTGLARDLGRLRRTAWSVLGTPVGVPLRRLSPTLNSRAQAGTALARLALGSTSPPDGHHRYAALRRGRITWIEPSALARRGDVAESLWSASARMVGMQASLT